MSGPRPAGPAILETARVVLERAGLDLVQPFQVDRVNAGLPPGHRLPDFSRPDALGLLVANSRALWPPFVAWLRDDPGRAELADPLDSFVERSVRSAADALPVDAVIRWSHGAAGDRIAAQRMAVACGLAHLSPTRLCVHPVFGPWIAIRAAIVLDAAGPSSPPAPLPDPCRGCTAGCRDAFSRALAASETDGHRSAWRAWRDVRAACVVGRSHRYCDDQIRYHGTVDRKFLRRLAAG